VGEEKGERPDSGLLIEQQASIRIFNAAKTVRGLREREIRLLYSRFKTATRGVAQKVTLAFLGNGRRTGSLEREGGTTTTSRRMKAKQTSRFIGMTAGAGHNIERECSCKRSATSWAEPGGNYHVREGGGGKGRTYSRRRNGRTQTKSTKSTEKEISTLECAKFHPMFVLSQVEIWQDFEKRDQGEESQSEGPNSE